MEYTRPQSPHFSAPMNNALETIRADETPPSSANNFSHSPASMPAQGPSANTPGLFPASPPPSPGPAVNPLCGSPMPPVAATQQPPWRANATFIRSNATLIDRTSPPGRCSLSRIEAAEVLLMLYHGREAPSRDPEETDSEEELAAKQLMELHAADRELGSAARPQPERVRRNRRRTRIEPAVVTEP
ncbi:hypothetical protein MMC31_006744, partial [Peltigera leucophlebia]|nr:hypothetical protein [Peltigera leucophlebia]